MAPYVGEIRMVGFNFVPAGWASCDGQLLPISENETLFNLIGTTYGGDGQETFALPNLQSRVPIHQGNTFTLAETGGAEEITLAMQQIPAHTHPWMASTDNGQESNPQGKVLGRTTAANIYQRSAANLSMAPVAVSPVGGSQPHSNLQPYTCIHFIISLFGVFPSSS